MTRERFIRRRRGDWQELENLLRTLTSHPMRKWSGRQVAELSRLYRSVCYDLSLVQSREWGMHLENYLNHLVAQGHTCLYRSPPRSLRGLADFLISGFPALVRRRIVFVYLSLALFAVPLLVSMLYVIWNPGGIDRIISPEESAQLTENFRMPLYEQVSEEHASERSKMAGFYIRNNIGIALRAVAGGMLMGTGTILILISNGIQIGAGTGFVISRGYSANYFEFTASHAPFELTAIVLAGAAGLLLGWGIVYPGKQSRLESLISHGRDAVRMAGGMAFLMFIAALIEGYFSPLPMSPAVKFPAAAMFWFLVLFYLSQGGRRTGTATAGDGGAT